MPGNKKKNKNKRVTKQEARETKENIDPSAKTQKNITDDSITEANKANHKDEVIIVEEIRDEVNSKQASHTKQTHDAASLSKSETGGAPIKIKEGVVNDTNSKNQSVKTKRVISDFVNNNENAMKNKNFLEAELLKEQSTSETKGGALMTIADYVAQGVPPEIAVMKHPLAHTWVLWWYRNDKSRTWEQNQEQIATVNTIEDFWQVYNYISPASQLGQGCDYALFKKGIQPDWEDFQNMGGGRWIINSDKNNRDDILDTHWLEILLILIGEHAGEFAEMMNGAVINIRSKGDKLAVWLKDANQLAGLMSIGQLVKTRLGIRDRINFSVHREEGKGNNRARFGSQNSPSKICV